MARRLYTNWRHECLILRRASCVEEGMRHISQLDNDGRPDPAAALEAHRGGKELKAGVWPAQHHWNSHAELVWEALAPVVVVPLRVAMVGRPKHQSPLELAGLGKG